MKPILNKLLTSLHNGMTDKGLSILFSQPSFSSIFDGVDNFRAGAGKMIEVIPSMYHLVGLSGAEQFFRLESTKSNNLIRILSLTEIKIGGADGGVDGIRCKGNTFTFTSCKFKNKRTVNEINSGRAALEGVANALIEDGSINTQKDCHYEIFLRNVNQFEDRRKNERTTVHDWVELDRMFNELKVYVTKFDFSVSKIDIEIRKNTPPAPLLRFHQRLANGWTIDCFYMGFMTLVLLLCARFGKTLMVCELMKLMKKKFGVNIFLLPSGWLSSHTSIKNTIYGFSDYSNMDIVETKMKTAKEIIECLEYNLKNDKISVVFFSLYSTAEFQDNVLVSVKKWFSLRYNKIMMILDEADHAAHTERSVKTNSSALDLSEVRKIYLSGTGTSKMVKGASREGQKIDDLFSITMTDIQLLKKGKHPLLPA